MSSIIKSLVMEIRPRLQSVNVFIIFNIDNVRENNDIEINLNLNSFEIILGLHKEIVKSDELFHIVPNSLSCLLINSNFLSFRFSTENIQQNLGTSKFEILENIQFNLNNNQNDRIHKNIPYNIHCANCNQEFCKQILFERVLPLPENLDTNDWFCHGHNNAIENLIPKTNEIFHTHCYVQVNEGLLKGLIIKGLNLVCKRCLAWIGIILMNTHKVWFNTVTFNDNNHNFTSCAVNDAFKTVRQILNNSLLGSIKIILTCQTSPTQKEFVLLWILEKSLKVRFDSNIVDVSKVLFKFSKSNDWRNDMNISIVDISKPMMIQLLKHLYEMNRYIPKDFSISNDFYVSYLMMYKN